MRANYTRDEGTGGWGIEEDPFLGSLFTYNLKLFYFGKSLMMNSPTSVLDIAPTMRALLCGLAWRSLRHRCVEVMNTRSQEPLFEIMRFRVRVIRYIKGDFNDGE